MKTILAALLILAACTKQNPRHANAPQPLIELEAATINLDMVDNQMTGVLETNDSLNWGDIYQGRSVIKRLVIFAKNDIPALDISGFRNAQVFTFKSSNCGTSLQKLRVCVIDTEFTPGSLGSLSEIITLSSEVSFALSANVIPAPIPPVVYNIELSTPLIRIASATSPITKIVYVRNKDSQNLIFNSDSINFNSNTVLRNSCAGISLKPLRQCWFELSFTAIEINSGRVSEVTVFDKTVTVDLGSHGPGSNLITGTFMDGAVSGMSYSTPSYSGTTDAAGAYTCNANETITFKIAGQTIAELPCSSVVSPIELATNGAKKYNQSFNSLSAEEQAKATNLAVLLQTLDSDNDASNGISITPAVASKLSEVLTGGSYTVSNLVASPSFTSELSQIIQSVNSSLSTTLAIVSTSNAMTHFDDTRLNQAVACAPVDMPDSITVTGVKPNCSATSCIAGYEVLAGKCEPTAEGITINPDPVDLGNFTTTKVKKTITITNYSNVAKAVKLNTSSFNTPGLSLVVTRACPAKLTPKISYCSVEFSYYSLDELTADKAISEMFIVNNSKNLAVNVVHKASAKIESSNFAWQNPPANLGTITGTSLTKKFTVKNFGSSLSGLSLSPTTLPAGVTMTKTCGTNLYIGSTCTVDLTFNPNVIPSGPFNLTLSYSNSTVAARLNIAATIVGQNVPCSLTDAQANGWNTNNYATIGGEKVGTNVSACVVEACSGVFAVSSGEKKCVLSIISCLLGNGSGTATWNGNAYGACVVDSCENNYTLASGQCVPSLCSITDVSFSSAVIGDKINGCSATACQNNYTLANGTCAESLCLPTDVNFSSAVSGTKISGCVATSCQANYTLANGVCVETLCAPIDVSFASAVTGTKVSGCSATACQNNYTLNAGTCAATQCLPSDVNFASAVSGTKISGCLATACQSNYTLVNGACSESICAPADVNFASAVTGTKVSGCLATACQTNYTVSNGTCIESICLPADVNFASAVTGTKVSGCSATSCQTNYTLNAGTCAPTQCLPSDVNFSATVTGTKVSGCAATTCQTNYEVIAGQCNPINCTAANAGINNAASVSGTKVSGCSLVSCESEYLKVGETCQGVACTVLNASGNGITSILNVNTVSGTINNDSCLVSSCNSYYKVATDSKSCQAKTCAELSAGELSTLGYNVTGGSLSGTYPTCNLTCSSNFQQVAVSGKSCEDKDIAAPAFSFNKNYTNQTTGNAVTVSATNAQEIGLFSDASCLTQTLSYTNLASFPNTVTVTAGAGTKNVYAKFRNGTKTSTCVGDSIVLDTTVPTAFTVTLGATTTTSETAAPSVSFSPALSTLDSGSGVYTVEYGIGTTALTDNISAYEVIPTTSNNFIASVANGYLAPAVTFSTATNYYILIRVTDNAGNVRSVASAAWTYEAPPLFTYSRVVSATQLPEETTTSQGGMITFASTGVTLFATSAATSASATYNNSMPTFVPGTYNIKVTVTYQVVSMSTYGSFFMSVANVGVPLPATAVGTYTNQVYTLNGVTFSASSKFTVRTANGKNPGCAQCFPGGDSHRIRLVSFKVDFL